MRLTLFLKSESDCMSWFNFLKKRGVPAAIIRSDNGYAVHRAGRIRRIMPPTVSARKLRNIPEINAPMTPIPGTYHIVRLCNGYTREGRRESA